MSFSCPLCHQPLTQANNSFVCPGRHQFDVAKEGYVNLLPVQHKRSRDPGDSAEMMQARRAFLDAGHYQPLRDAIVNVLKEKSNSEDAAIPILAVGKGITPMRLPTRWRAVQPLVLTSPKWQLKPQPDAIRR